MSGRPNIVFGVWAGKGVIDFDAFDAADREVAAMWGQSSLVDGAS